MEIVITKSFRREFKRLPVNAQRAVQTVLEKLRSVDALETAGVDCAPIRGYKAGHSYYRIRIGHYRMGIEYVAPDVIVITIAVRGDIYKTFPPK
ncbi:type II toxin-antitoxin system RelE family toxin [Dyadobacter jiangsuensis]|uniref:type II toxin-antitoxin system RelE family toxin n=1 Tax=Dyadobacter fermentans TaxID=94254 RepID=UPI001CBF4B96|nr:type II toxin-antitoxin system RelE/ParE family toxin [Dyadobacter fermentans]